MIELPLLNKSIRVVLLSLVVLSFSLALAVKAQTPDDLEETKSQIDELFKKVNYVDALPLIEKVVKAEPKNSEMHFKLGTALIAKSLAEKDPAARKAFRVRAREAFIRSKELGNNNPPIDALIAGLPPDGSESGAFSQNPEANSLMVEAEGFFGQGKLDQALENYQKALKLDPAIYEAALFSGDVYMNRGDFAQAEVWYQRAIAINPNRETAYRYSATPLMKQNKINEARDRYVEAFITEPYSKFARGGLIQWAQATQTPLAHPKIDVPIDVTFDEKGNAKITEVMGNKEEDGTSAWLMYGMVRTSWHNKKFAETFPNEKSYRHSLVEEAEALRAVVNLASTNKKVKTLNPSLAKLKKLNDDGLLESYILLALVDEGISRDYRDYLGKNREKLRRYVLDYVINREE
jgi:tetratricopeptide (TPR) repeat protein